MPWIEKISFLSGLEKEGLVRLLIAPSIFHRFGINPLTLRDERGSKAARFFCPRGDRTCLCEIKLSDVEDPIYSIQLSDTNDFTQIDFDFLIINDPDAPRFNTHLDEQGKDSLFGLATRNLPEEQRAMEAGLFPGQVRKGLGLTREVVFVLDYFCRVFDIKSIRLQALFYHNAITYERCGFSYFSRYNHMKRIHELFQPGGELFNKLDNSTPFRKPEFADTIRGRSWAIHDGILSEINDAMIAGDWVSPIMYRMVGKPRAMITFPNSRY
ncbi:MAG: hypothetical protein AB2L11_10710 [Syntrophobacteraceae bacterium]